LALLGIGAGLPLAIGMTTMLSSIFFGVRPFDLRVFAGAAAVLIVTAILASWWPARRAMTMDPMSVLRS
jgi:ABC-type antimicrobial peptide transport system permease subunit